MPPKIYNAKNAKTAKNAKKANKAKNANLLRSATQSATTKAYSTTMGLAKKGGRQWSPPGGLQSAAPPQVGHGVLDNRHKNVQGPTSDAKPYHVKPGCSYTPL